ncbi:S-layer protein [Clostridium acetobutylicum]|nr:S-layer protein [Clostridium acetobutylicum]
MSRKDKRLVSFLVMFFMIAGFVVNMKDIANASPQSTKPIEVVLAADAVSNNLDLTGFSDALKADLSSRYGISSSRVFVSSVDSTINSNINSFPWKRFDHTNTNATVNDANNYVVQYTDPNVTNITSTHIQIAGDGKSVTFLGYGIPAFKDFLITPNYNANNKVFNFTLDEGAVDYHTLDGAGFLFGSKYTYDSSGNRRLSGYATLMGSSVAGIYEFKNIDVTQFTQETSQTVIGYATTLNTPVNLWGGTVTLLSKTNKPASVGGLRYLKLVASPTSASLYQFTDGNYNTTSSAIFTNVALPDTFGEFDFGPIASYQAHNCGIQTRVTYSNITMQEDTSVGFADLVRSTNWKYNDSMKLVVNVDNDGVSDFNDYAKYSSILYYMMLNNSHYVGWGINNSISGGTVESEANGFISRNNSRGTFINRSNAATDSLSEGVAAISDYIAGKIDSESTIDKPNLSTVFNGSGQVTVSTPDTTTSNGNPIGDYSWRVLNVVTGVWEDKGNSRTTALTFPQGTYSIVNLRIKDSVTGQWSNYASSYVATVANIAPVSQFKLSTSALMPDTSVAALRTGTQVTATDMSYIPNGDNIANWEWTVYDSVLQPISALTKTYSSSNKPSNVTFDFNGLGSGSYTIKLRTQNANGDWSAYYSQKLTIYKETNTISITTTENTTGTNLYSGTKNVPYSIVSSGSNITSYRTIKIFKGQLVKSDWKKVNALNVSDNASLTGEVADLYVQALDASGNSKSAFVGSYTISANVSMYYVGTTDPYVNNTPTNKDITFTFPSDSLQYSTDNGQTWEDMHSPMTVSTGGKYIFRGYGDSDASHYVTKDININKVFNGSAKNIDDGGKYRGDVTIDTTNFPNAIISVDNGTEVPYGNNTTLSDDGNYKLTGTDIYGNTKTYNFIIDKVLPTINVTGNSTQWTKNDVALNISKTAGASGVSKVTVIKDNGTPVDITENSSYTVSENGNYTFTVINGAGASASTVVNVDKIDKVKPSIAVSSMKIGDQDYNYSATVPAEKDVTVNLENPNNVASGVKYYYSTNGTDWNPIEGTSYTVTNTGNATVNYKFKAVSNSGIESDVLQKDVYIIKPNYTNNIVNTSTTSNGADYNGQWTNKDINFVLSGGISEAAFVKYQYSTDPSDEASWKDMQGANFNELTVSKDQDAKYYFRAVSKGGSYGSVTSGAELKLDKTIPTDMTVALKENKFTEFLNTISFNLFFKDTLDVNIYANNDISGIDHYDYQVVEDGTGDAYSENGPWKTYSELKLSRQFKGVVYARAIDKAGNISKVVSSDGFIVDNNKATAPKITATAGDKTYNSSWTASDINIVLSNSTAFSDIAGYQYKAGSNGSWTDMPLSSDGTLKDKITINQNTNKLYYFRAVSKSGVYGEENSLMIRRDALAPSTKVDVTGAVNSWTSKSVKFDVSNANDNNIAPISYYIKIGSADWNKMDSTTYTFNNEINSAVQFKAVSDAGVENVSNTIYNVMIDKTTPTITGATQNGSYSIGRVIGYNDNFGQIETATYKKDNGAAQNLTSGSQLTTPGAYSLEVVDKSGNRSTLNFTLKALPSVNDVLYTSDSKNAIDAIRNELNTHNDLKEPYASQIKASVKALEDRYADLEKEVVSLKDQTSNIVKTVDSLPNGKDGIIALENKIQSLYDKMAGGSSTLTNEQYAKLINESLYLKDKLNAIKALKDQVASVEAAIKALPAKGSVKKADVSKINAVNDSYNALNKEQKALVNPDLVTKLNDVVAEASKLLLHNAPNGITVTGVDGTKFSPDTVLVVDPIKEEGNQTEFNSSADYVKKATLTNDKLKGKELVALYDVSILKNNVKIQPDGKVQVKIKIPTELGKRINLDIVHIADNGKVTSMNAKSDGEYLTFITTHFSKYGIVATDTCWFGICRAFGIYKATGGVCYDWAFILGALVIVSGMGFGYYRYKKRDDSVEEN